MEDPSDGIVVSGDFTAFYPKSPPSTCALGGGTNSALTYDAQHPGKWMTGSPSYLTFSVQPYTGAGQRYTVGIVGSITSNYAQLWRGHDDGWESTGGSVTIIEVANGVVSVT